MTLEERLDTALNDLSEEIHASFGDNKHEYCEGHINEAKQDILAIIKEETVRAQIDELGKAYPEMRRSIHGESNYYYDERIAQLQAELEEK